MIIDYTYITQRLHDIFIIHGFKNIGTKPVSKHQNLIKLI